MQSEWNRTSQALADIEAAALATRASGEAEHLELGCAFAVAELDGKLLTVRQKEWLDAEHVRLRRAERIRRAKR